MKYLLLSISFLLNFNLSSFAETREIIASQDIGWSDIKEGSSYSLIINNQIDPECWENSFEVIAKTKVSLNQFGFLYKSTPNSSDFRIEVNTLGYKTNETQCASVLNLKVKVNFSETKSIGEKTLNYFATREVWESNSLLTGGVNDHSLRIMNLLENDIKGFLTDAKTKYNNLLNQLD